MVRNQIKRSATTQTLSYVWVRTHEDPTFLHVFRLHSATDLPLRRVQISVVMGCACTPPGGGVRDDAVSIGFYSEFRRPSPWRGLILTCLQYHVFYSSNSPIVLTTQPSAPASMIRKSIINEAIRMKAEYLESDLNG